MVGPSPNPPVSDPQEEVAVASVEASAGAAIVADSEVAAAVASAVEGEVGLVVETGLAALATISAAEVDVVALAVVEASGMSLRFQCIECWC